ncbi:hypothetical protein [Methylohalobius crimeensis]|uniref:hypothetical protein n=1 Tax=Methylohalobius crimeensis TaxID=244365 RepID=UPI00041ED515|nr:hypothetical protein [Methylohalobius crimeensis]
MFDTQKALDRLRGLVRQRDRLHAENLQLWERKRALMPEVQKFRAALERLKTPDSRVPTPKPEIERSERRIQAYQAELAEIEAQTQQLGTELAALRDLIDRCANWIVANGDDPEGVSISLEVMGISVDQLQGFGPTVSAARGYSGEKAEFESNGAFQRRAG